MINKIFFLFILSLFLLSCSSTKPRSSEITEKQLNALLNQLQKEAKAEIKYSNIEIEKNDNFPDGVNIDCEFQIFEYRPNQKYSLNIMLIVNGRKIEIFKKEIFKSKDQIKIKKQFTKYIKSRLAETKTVKFRFNIYKILDENMNNVQDLCQVTSDEIEL